MHILLMNYILGGGTGSETWTASLHHELEKLGHTVTTSTDATDLPELYDLAIINHNTCFKTVSHLTCKKIFTSHGVIPDLEQPIPGADVYVSVSEEVQHNLLDKGFTSVVIRNGIDLNKFHATKPVNDTLTSVLFSSNYPGTARLKVKLACEQLGIRFETIGGNFKTPHVVEAINRADLVFGLGRTAYEAMACERNVIIYDYNGGDGFVTPDTMLEYRKHNCSGRRYKHDYTVEDIKALLTQYDPALGTQLRSYIMEHNNMALVAQKYLLL
jgi:hypothetical protein